MEVIIQPDSQAAACACAEYIERLLLTKSGSVLGLATGSTPLQLYRKLISLYQSGVVSFENCKTFNLDEYVGVGGEDKISYRYYMNKNFFDHIDIDLSNTHLPNGLAKDPDLEAQRYENLIKKAGGIDLQVLGIGRNGHIGFNEPSSSLVSRTRIKTLSKSTIDDNSRLLDKGDFQPYLSLTMGIGTILDSQQIVMLATGKHKAPAVKAAIEGAVSAMCPASVLQLHPNVKFVVDEEAASQLELKEYYQWVSQTNAMLNREN